MAEQLSHDEEIPPKGILKTDSLLKYIYDTYAYPREHELLKKLREATIERYGNLSEMAVPVDEGQFLSMLVKLMNAKKTIEIGVFTGYSVLVTALALPPDGHITAIDPIREGFELGLSCCQKAGVAHKVDFIESEAMPVLDKMVNDGEEEFDFAFVDADKSNYINYHEKLLKLVKIGGVIAYDNTLWFGFVSEEDEEKVPESMRDDTKHLKDFNTSIASDPRVDVSHVSIADGLTLCRRLH